MLCRVGTVPELEYDNSVLNNGTVSNVVIKYQSQLLTLLDVKCCSLRSTDF